jgi:hypothetical protein
MSRIMLPPLSGKGVPGMAVPGNECELRVGVGN